MARVKFTLYYNKFSHYINYRLLKNKIKDLKILQDKDIISPDIDDAKNEGPNLDQVVDLELIDHLENQTKGKTDSEIKIIKKKYIAIGKYVNDFLSSLDSQIQKFNDFYFDLEKEIKLEFIKIKRQFNTIIHIANDLKEILEIVENIDLLTNKILNICQYININITAIRKILKKFDKKFTTNENPIALHYLNKNLRKTNSSLVYILQFKIVDESSALLDKFVTTLEISFFKRLYKNKVSSEELLHEPLLLKEINIEELSGPEINKNMIKVIKKKFNKIKQKLEKIDDSNNLIRSGIEIWSLIIKSNMRVVDDYFKTRANLKKENKENLKDIILEKLTPQLQRDEEYHMTWSQKLNIFFVLTHTFIYTMNCYIVQPTNGLYITELGSNKTLSGLIMGLTHLAAIFCTFFYSYWTNYSYKMPLIISCLLFIIGNFFYSLAEHYRSLLIMGIGRFLIGFASARVVNRRYIIDQVPRHLIMHFSLIYVGLTCMGMAAGPFIALLLLAFMPQQTSFYSLNFNSFTNPGWFCAGLWLIFELAILIFFKDPDNVENVTTDSNNTKTSDSFTKEGGNANTNSNAIAKDNKYTNSPKKNNAQSITNDFEHDIQEIIYEEESTYSYMSIAFTVLISILLVIRVKFFI